MSAARSFETKHLSGAYCQVQFPAHLCEIPTVRAERGELDALPVLEQHSVGLSFEMLPAEIEY